MEGGLGLRSLKEANEVCCLKLIWRIISHGDSLWVKWIKMYLLKNESFWSIKETTSLGSWMWKKLLKYRATAKHFCKVEIKNGAHTSFWYDDWSDLGRLVDIAGARGVIDLGINRKATVAEAWQNRRLRRHRVALLNLMKEALLEKWQNRSVEGDMVLWKGKNDVFTPRFSTKDTWNHIRTTSNKTAWHKGVWFAHATPKYSFVVWLAILNRLSTGDRMLQWNKGLATTCVLCNSDIESRDHLFFSCAYASEVWENLAKNIFKSNYTTDWGPIINCVSNRWTDRVEGFIARYVLQATIHSLWRERNGRRHGENPNPISRLVSWIDKQVRNQLSAIKTSGDRRYDSGLQIWFASRS